MKIAKEFGKSVAIWIIIGVLLAVLFNIYWGAEALQRGRQHLLTPINLLTTWWPLLLLIATGLFFMRQMLRRRRPKEHRQP